VDPVGDVLDRLIAEVREANVQLVSHLLMHGRRDADATGLGQRLQASRNVDAVPVDPVALGGDVAHVDADPEVHAALIGETRVERPEHPLGLDGTADRVEGGRKLGQEVVAGGVHDAAAVLSDAHRDVFAIVRQRPDRGGLVLRHQS
jgi:hypothetical protein